jgi:hypothetical protein
MYSCDSNADCINTVGSYSCQCRNGYTGDGRVCTGNFRRISDIFRYANYVIAGICYIIVCLWKHHVNLLRTIICFIAMQTYKELVYVMFY